MSDLTEQKINALFHAVELLIELEVRKLTEEYGRNTEFGWPVDAKFDLVRLMDLSDELKSLLVPRIGLEARIHEALDAHQPPLPFEPALSKFGQIKALAAETDQELLKMDGFDDCIAGVVMQFGRPTITCYDLTKVIDKLIAGGMNHFEAYEWWEYNQVGAYMGESTPCFLDPLVGSGE